MLIEFKLSMPGRNSWDGRWSGDGELFAIVRSVTPKAKAEEIIEKGSYTYRWDDGWRAWIEVREVNSSQAARTRKHSKGFCGYDWMVDTIIKYGEPMATHEIKESANACLDNQ